MTHSQIDQIVLNELLDFWNMNETEIERLITKEGDTGLEEFQRIDLEDSLDLRVALKRVIQYCTHKDQRKKLGFVW
jgi:hypothetical protein